MNIQAPNPLNWQDYINIGGFAFGLIGVILATVSIWYAARQTKLAREQKAEASEANFKVKTAEEAVAELKRELYRRNAAQFHDTLSNRADSLVTAVRSSFWDEAYGMAQKVGAGIQNSMGAYQVLLDEEAVAQFGECTSALSELLRLLPMPGEQALADDLRSMQQLATIVNFGTQRVAGKIRLIAEIRTADVD